LFPKPTSGAGNIWTSIFSGLGFAKGGVFAQGGAVTAFARGGIVNHPTVFPFARGVGLMAEAGPEAIMPLRRGADGRLGVAAANNNGGALEVHVTVDVADNGKLAAYVDGVSRRNARDAVSAAAPRLLASANAAAPAAVAAYRRDIAGGDYRVA
jgi:phage-related minor tail protein